MGSFDGQVALVTGAGDGLGRAHALALATEGATVIVNDVDVSAEVAGSVVEEIRASGGRAEVELADVSALDQVEAMTERILERLGRIDVLICNAGILRDRTFAKMELADFTRVLQVHLEGSANCCHAVWSVMRDQVYGRILLTTSSSGLYGNFGQSNYGAAKAGMIGLMNCLHFEGLKYDIRINCLSPAAATAMTEGLLAPEDERLLDPNWVSPAALYLTGRNSPSKTVMGAGGGVFSTIRIVETEGVWLPEAERTPQGIAEAFSTISDRSREEALENAFEQTAKYVRIARARGGT